MGITIKDIATIAGVSTSTVSLVMSGKGYVSNKTRQKVQNVIDEYNYRPLLAARQLANNRTGNLGFIISDVHLARSEAFYSRVLHGAELEARNYDTSLILSSVAMDLVIPGNIPRFLQGRDVDGVIVAGSVPDELIRYLKNENIPLVLIDYRIPDLKIDTVFMDNRLGLSLVINHLVSQKIKKIAFIGGSNRHPSIKERFEGYQIAMEHAGLGHISRDEKYRYFIESETNMEVGIEGISEVLKNIPDIEAVVCVNDTTAAGCIQQLRKLKKRIPKDIAVVGFDNNNYASMTHPPLTSVQVPKIELGVEAIRLLISRIENPQQIHQTRIIPVDLIIRESSLKSI